jgi:hypothetical protein
MKDSGQSLADFKLALQQPTLGFMQFGLDQQTSANCKAKL